MAKNKGHSRVSRQKKNIFKVAVTNRIRLLLLGIFIVAFVVAAYVMLTP